MRRLNKTLLLFFFALSILAWIASFCVEGWMVWLSFLTLGIWGIVAGNIILAIFQLFTKNKKWIFIPLLACGLQLKFIQTIFQTPVSAIKDDKENTLTVISYNASHFFCNKQYTMDEATDYIKGLTPDILCFQESPCSEYYQADSIRNIFKFVPYSCHSYRTDHLPMSIYSRYPIRWINTLYYTNSVNLSMVVDVDINGKMVRVINNHLQTTGISGYKGQIVSPERDYKLRIKSFGDLVWAIRDNFQRRAKQADRIRDEIEKSPYPVIVCGDFNDTPASYTYRRIKGNLVDGFIEAGSGYQYTFRQLKRLWRIDYILHSKEFQGTECYSPDLPYSDHNMVVWKGKIRAEEEIR